MFEDHKAKKAAEAHEKALAQWKAERDGCAELLDVTQNFLGTTADTVMLGANETVFLKVSDASLIEDRRGPGHYAGHSQGVSIPIAHVGGRPIRYRVGVNKGHFVQGTPTPTAIDTGAVFITNKRVIFQGMKQTRECVFTKLVGYQSDDNEGSTTFSVSNRQKPTTIHYGASVADTFDFRLELALAHFRGDVGALVEQLQDQLTELDEHRPPDHTVPPPSTPKANLLMGSEPKTSEESVPSSEPGKVQRDPFFGPDASSPDPDIAGSSVNPMVGPSEHTSASDQDGTPSGQTVSESPSAVPPGWYSDPWKVAPLRWWNGSGWSGYTNGGS